MAIIILPVCLIVIVLNLAIYAGALLKKTELLLGSTLIFCSLLLAITETLNFFNAITYTGILACWLIVTIAGCANIFLHRFKLNAHLKIEQQLFKDNLKKIGLPGKLMAGTSFILLTLIFLQGLIYPPNNWDSMTYHLARVSSWIAHGSIDAFPTHIVRQIYQPPFAEFVLLHFNILSKSDIFANSVQFIFLVFTLPAIIGIIQALKLNRRMQGIAVLLCITIPEVILQASSTQNDLVVTFFTVCAVYFSFKTITRLKLQYYWGLGLSAGLALLTKGTAYIYIAPLLLVCFAIMCYQLFTQKKFVHVTYGIIGVLFALVVNVPNWLRNYNITGSFLGIDKREGKMYANESMSAGMLASNVVKNLGMHAGVKGDNHIATISDSIIHKLHAFAAIDINDKRLNYLGIKYSTNAATAHEDSAPNMVHFFLVAAAFALILYGAFTKKLTVPVSALAIVVALQLLLFSAYLKWQPWHSRLHVTMFIIAVPVVCYAAAVYTLFKKALYITLPLVCIYGLMIIFSNEMRPLKPHRIKQERYEKYFSAKPHVAAEYKNIVQIIKDNHFKNIGLILNADDWQYPLFVNSYTTKLTPVHILVDNFTANSGNWPDSIDCIVSTKTNADKIAYKGKYFYNQNPDNKTLRIYK